MLSLFRGRKILLFLKSEMHLCMFNKIRSEGKNIVQNSNGISSATLYTFINNADVNSVNLSINNNQVTFNVTDKIDLIKLSNASSS